MLGGGSPAPGVGARYCRTRATRRYRDVSRQPNHFDEHFFVLQAAPQAFNEDVVEEPALAVRATAHTTTFPLIEKRSTVELYALIGVEHLRLAKALHRLLQRFLVSISPDLLHRRRT